MNSTKQTKRRSLYVGAELANLVEELTGNTNTGFSTIINQIGGRYQALMAEYLPSFSADEMLFIWFALEDAPRQPIIAAVSGTSYLVHQAIDKGTHPELDIDTEQLRANIDRLEFAELLSLADSTERYWAAQGNDDDG